MKKEILAAALGMVAAGCSDKAKDSAKPSAGNDAANQNITPEHLDTLLSELAGKSMPLFFEPGAMCYWPGRAFHRYEYDCPVCGGKTIWTDTCHAYQILSFANENRQFLAIVKKSGLDASLDEQSLCGECRANGNAPEFGEIYLNVTLNNVTTKTLLKDYDMRKLAAFLQGRETWVAKQEEEFPLKPELPRIRQLLGVNEPTGENP